MKKTVLIFDMDGVLVEPRRYRAALAGTLDYFGNLMGWEALYPGEETIAWFESRGISSEWDIAPLYLAAVFEAILTENPSTQFSQDLLSSCKSIKSSNINKPVIEYASHLEQLPGRKISGLSFCDLVLHMVHGNSQKAPFEKLSSTPLFFTLLNESRNIHSNLVTRVFQEMCLGKTDFTNTFRMPVISESQPASLINDREIISPAWKKNLLTKRQTSEIEMVIYTARPSAPKLCPTDGKLEFSPEADIVINQLGWQQVPVIGLGQLKYAADQIGCSTEDLIKPSPAHALAAIGTALTGNFVSAIQAGWNLMNATDTNYYDDVSELEIHIFEDSPTGITGAIGGVDLLRKHGVSIELVKWGISSDKNKIEKLLNLECNIKTSINEALDSIIEINR